MICIHTFAVWFVGPVETCPSDLCSITIDTEAIVFRCPALQLFKATVSLTLWGEDIPGHRHKEKLHQLAHR